MFLRKEKANTIFTITILVRNATTFCYDNRALWKARRKEKEGGPPYLEEALLEAERKVTEVELRQLVELPPGLDYNEWLASHTLSLFEHVNLLYGTITEFCTTSSCPDMTGPKGRHYAWQDDKGRKTRLSAPQYVDYVMTSVQRSVYDEATFPTKFVNDFPATFEATVRKILRLLYHVVAHMYHAHFRDFLLLGLHAHLHCVFAHLSLMDIQFHVLDEREVEVLQDLVVALKLLPEQPVQETTPSLPQDEAALGDSPSSTPMEGVVRSQSAPATTSGSFGATEPSVVTCEPQRPELTPAPSEPVPGTGEWR
nr:EOG090X0E0F [Triops cancriformis]